MEKNFDWREAFSGSFEDNQSVILAVLDLERPEDVDIVQVQLCPHEGQVEDFVPEEGKYWSMVFVDFLNKQVSRPLGKWFHIKDWEKEAADCFFRGVPDHPGFLRSFRSADTIRTNTKVES